MTLKTIPISPDTTACMQRVQQRLLADGYRYLAADRDAWPSCDVWMGNERGALLLAYWHASRATSLLEYWTATQRTHPGAGLLLIGDAPVDDPALVAFMHSLPGGTAYVDAVNTEVMLYASSRAADPAQREAMLHLVVPRADDPAAEIDCRAALARDLATVEQPATPANTPPPYLTYSLIAACVLVYLLMLAMEGSLFAEAFRSRLVNWGALYGPAVQAGEWWRLFTSVFLHGGVLHLFMNMLALLAFARTLETWQGPWRLGLVFLYSAIAGNLLSLALLPASASVGASGGLFGLMGFTAAVLARYYRTLPAGMRGELFRWLKTTLILNLFISFIPGINFAAHLGGLLGGFLMGAVVAASPLQRTPLPRWSYAVIPAVALATAWLGSLVV